MKKIFYLLIPVLVALGLFLFYRGGNDNLTASGAETVNYEEGQIIAKNEHYYRKFDHKTPDNLFVVQDFYTGFNSKLTDPFTITRVDQLTKIPSIVISDGMFYRSLTIFGILRMWTKEGLPIEEMHFSNGKVTGLYMKWYPNGKKMFERSYKANIANGIWYEWYESGQLKVEGNYEHAKKQGLWRERFADGAIALEDNYSDDILNGYHVFYNKDHVKREEGNYVAGQREGAWFLADDSNVYTSQGSFENGKKNGLWIDYYKGIKATEGHYLNGQKDGLWTYWYSQNAKLKEEVYKEGVKVSEKKLMPDKPSEAQ